jgi:hypothetical protein
MTNCEQPQRLWALRDILLHYSPRRWAAVNAAAAACTDLSAEVTASWIPVGVPAELMVHLHGVLS